MTLIPVGQKLVRIFDPTRRHATPLTFRHYGPLKRFDHHRGTLAGEPGGDPERGIYYAAWSEDLAEAFSSCVVEVFGDTGLVETGELLVAVPRLTRPLTVLDLRGAGAMRAGTVAAVAKCEYRLSQPWSRYFYEDTSGFDLVDGLYYRNAHNDEPALALYERAQAALLCAPEDVIRLDHPSLRPILLDVMRRNNLFF